MCRVLSVLCVIFWGGEREVLLDNFLETLICSYFFLRVNKINQLTLKKIRTVLKWSWIMGLDNSRHMDSSRTMARKVVFLELSCLICNDHLLNESHGGRYWALIWRRIRGMDGLPRWLSGKVLPTKQEMQVWSLSWENPLEEGMAWQPTLVFLDRGAWGAIVHGGIKTWTWPSNYITTARNGYCSEY